MADSRFQEGHIKRYYENRGTMSLQKLGEMTSDLFLCDDPKKASRLWDRIAKALKHTDAQPADIQKVLNNRDITELSRLVNQLSSPNPSGPKSSPSSTPATTGKPTKAST